MSPIERALRVMTHLNIGATLAMAAWVLYTGQQIVAGEREVGPRPSFTPSTLPATQEPPQATEATRMALVVPTPQGLRT